MKRRTLIKFQQLAVVVVAWAICGFIISVYDHLLLHAQIALGPSDTYSFTVSVLRNVGAGVAGALLGGGFMIFYVNTRYADKPYAYTIISVAIFFLVVVALIAVITGLTLASSLTDFLSDEYPIKSALVWLFVVITTQLFLQINSKFGYGSFWNIIRGKYQVPVTEQRVFMFLDLNQSTAIAERLGNEKYHALLKDFFYDMTNPVLDCNGSIYQYVGDEAVISWLMEDGHSNANCIRCFFQIKQSIKEQNEKYMSTYGVVPAFKAGVHCGDVVAGEVGVVKRDITYSGDVLNTTSRIQGMCKEFQVELIASHDVVGNMELPKGVTTTELGSIKLRGKERGLGLVAVNS